MKVAFRGAALVATLLTSGSCGAGNATATQATAWEAQPHTTAHFSFTYGALDKATIAQTGAALEAEYSRIVADLGGTAPPTVRIWLYANHDDLVRALEPLIGTVPSWAMGAAARVDQIHMMSPNASGFGSYTTKVVALTHEFAHCVSLRRNSGIANNPRWLWESVAIYESGQKADPKTLPYMVALTPPSFASMGSYDNARVYEVGYTIGEFIVSRWGQQKMAELISNNGNVTASTGLTQAQFESDWFAFVRQRYGF